MTSSVISFPGLGIAPFALDRVAINLGSIKIYWYGIIICLGIILGFLVAFVRMKKLSVTADDLADIALVCVPCAIIGARLYYVLSELDSYDTLYEAVAIWNGGLAIYGGVIAGVLAFTFVCKKKKKPLLKMYDAASPGLILGQIIGRWGNFFNAEAYGVADKYEFFGKTVDISSFSEKNPLGMTIDGVLVHPTFLYESLWNFVGFVLMNVFFEKKKFDGEVLVWYLTWYGFGRCIIEGLRGDSLYIGNIRISQLVAFVCFAAGVLVMAVKRIKIKKEKRLENGNNN